MTHVPYPGCYCADCVENPSVRITGDKDRENPAEGVQHAEPVAWMVDDLTTSGRTCGSVTLYTELERAQQHVERCGARFTKVTPLYTARLLALECHRLRSALRWIADTGYVDQQSGNQNFEHLQSIARDALTKEPTP